DEPASLARPHPSLVRVDAREGDHDVRVLLRGFGDLLVGNAAPSQLGLRVDGEHDEADVALAVGGDAFGDGGPAAGAEVTVGGAIVLLAVLVERVPARDFGVGVDVDRDEILMLHAAPGLRRPGALRQSSAVYAAGRDGAGYYLLPPPGQLVNIDNYLSAPVHGRGPEETPRPCLTNSTCFASPSMARSCRSGSIVRPSATRSATRW